MPGTRSLPIVEANAGTPRQVARAASRVLLVCMPFQHLELSSLSLSLLATLLKNQGIACREAYLHLDFARLIGRRPYTIVSDSGARNSILGEVLFAEQRRRAFDACTDRALTPVFGDRRRRDDLMQRFAAICLEQVDRAPCDLVGFTTSFNQLLPSLWLARLIKDRWPETRIVLGGASCSSPMGERIAEYYPDVDLVVSGFGEQPLLDFAGGRIAAESRFVHHDAPLRLDALPVPDYEPFVRAWEAFDDGSNGAARLAFESSRGCWWGQKHHCKFCGLNQLEMAFNAKSSARVVEEVRTLWDRHRRALFATDTILSRQHLKEALPQLARYPQKPELFYEVKPNMTRSEVATLRAANVTAIQPGIESLSSRLLVLLDKGVKAIQNVALLKWCRELGIAPTWNLLYGIPGEHRDDYAVQLDVIERIPHFAPPEGAHLIQIDRFSPYFRSYREHGWTGLEPLREYRLLHPDMSEEALGDVAYHFTGLGSSLPVAGYERELHAAVERWKSRHAAGDGLYRDPAEGLLSVSEGRVSRIDGDDRIEAVVACTGEIVSVERVIAETGADDDFLAELQKFNVLWREGHQLINLVVDIPEDTSG